MIRARLFHGDRPPSDALDLAWPDIVGDDANLLWVDLEQPTEAELARAVQDLKIDRRIISLAQQVNRRPTVRVYPDAYLVTVLAVDVEETQATPRIKVIEIDIVVGANYMVTLHKRPLPFWDALVERTATNPHIGGFVSAYLLYILLDSLLDSFSAEFDEVEDRVGRLEERLLNEMGRQALSEAMRMKRHVQNLRRLTAPHREALSTLISPDSPVGYTPEVDVQPFRDLLARMESLIARLDHIRDLALGSYDLYMSNMTHRTNQQLRVLTFISAVLLPMTLIVGLFGTNFKLAEYDTWQGFYEMLAGMAVLSLGMLLFFHRKGWL